MASRPKAFYQGDYIRRPKLTDELVLGELLERLMIGEPMYSIFADPMMPSPQEFYGRLASGDEISEKLQRARIVGIEAEFDNIIEIADTAPISQWQKTKIRVAVRMNRIEKLMPKKYGALVPLAEKLEAENGGGDANVRRLLIENDPYIPPSTGDEDQISGAPSGTEDDL